MSLRSWDGATYDRISTPMEELARPVIDRLELRGDETVLDAGCGSGRVTALLLERLPRGRVIGVDGSAAMIATARERLGDAVDLRVADLAELDLGGERVDAVLSTATFHWIADHEALFARLRAVLRDGGRLAAQCGGRGQVAAIQAAHDAVAGDPRFAEHFAGWAGPWTFAGPEETEARLCAAGFAEARAWLELLDVTFDDQREWLRAVALGTHLERLPAALHDPYLDAIYELLGTSPTLAFVRLNLDAIA